MRFPKFFDVLVLTFVCVLTSTLHAQTIEPLPERIIEIYGQPPSVPEGPLSPAMQFAIRVAFVDSTVLGIWDANQQSALAAIAQSGDPRLAWLISDMLRFISAPNAHEALTQSASTLLDKEFKGLGAWLQLTNHLLAWDIPAPPEYLDYKRAIYTYNIKGWEDLFIEGDIDWRLVSWGGVPIDDRAHDATDFGCRCIPAADNPKVSNAENAMWLQDDDIIFGIEINGQARAYPRRIMEVREMVNDTLGGRDIAIPYCTLCGAAQAYFTDNMPEGVARPILRTSGLLSRSNKVMYDLNTHSIFDTFKGKAVTGPLAEKGLSLQQTSVVTSNWGDWKKAHPQTTVLLERYALGRNPDFRHRRDANGPIFPIGDVDPRLPVHEDIIGAITTTGTPIAFPRSTAYLTLTRGGIIEFDNLRLQLAAGGIKVVDKQGADVPSHEAFWFAWSQFYPQTVLWTP